MSIEVSDPLLIASIPAARPGQFFNRAYQACINCRKRKVKCIIESNAQGSLQSSCTRCRRELRQCVFSADRRNHTTLQDQSASSQRTVSVTQEPPTNATSRQAPIASIPCTPVTPNSIASNGSDANGLSRTRKRARDGNTQPSNNRDSRNMEAHTQAMGVLDNTLNSRHSTVELMATNTLNLNSERQAESDLGGSVDYDAEIETSENLPPPSNTMNHRELWTTVRHYLSTPSQETLDAWKPWCFVKTGLITAQEAVTYVDLFFRNMSILSPILHNYYQNHENHNALVTRDPVLCCTIIALSARYHILAGDGGLSRGYYIHDRLWKHCQSLFHRVTWDERRAVKNQMQHLGTIESLLIVTEWHPRSSHLPVDADYYELDIGSSDVEETLCHSKVPNKWLQEVEETAQRSDRMSWMLLGNALTLGHELDLFDSNDDTTIETTAENETLSFDNYLLIRRGRLRRLLFVYISQLASRIGCALPKTPFHQTISSSMSIPNSELDNQWHDHMTSWIDLSRLVRTSSEFLFPSKTVTKELLRSGRYSDLLDHFRPLLSQWLEKYSQIPNPTVYHQFLLIDYQFVRLYINSLALQAVANRMAKQQNYTIGSELESSSDFVFIREVISGSRQILHMVIKLADEGHLKYIPVRIYIRIASASIYLINALSLGGRRNELDQSLSLVDRAVEVLSLKAVDDVHLGVRYASLLKNCIKGLRQRFVRVHNPLSSPPFSQYNAGFLDRENPGSNDANLRSEVYQRSRPLGDENRFPDSDANQSTLLEPIKDTAEDTIDAITGQNISLEEGGESHMSESDWLALPLDLSNDVLESTFMETFFDLDPVDTRYFWDISL